MPSSSTAATRLDKDSEVSTCIAAPTRSFIETQFPVSKLSKESYKERKANNSQTLTGLGKWWGRKPLIMVRAVILGLLMPASDDADKDRAVFLALLTMDDEGLRRRKARNIPLKEVYRRLSPQERGEWFVPEADPNRPKYKKGTRAEERQRLQYLVFDRMGYDEKLRWCDRPEQVDGPSEAAWRTINAHLGTSAVTLQELVRELGLRRFGRVPRVGDAFSGGGSVPFEAARLGCEAFGSDLNPVAALLTWGALKIVGGSEEVAEQVRQAQADVFEAVDKQVTEWRIEHNDAGWRADAFLYCTETICPECGWLVPMAPSWVIGEKSLTIGELSPETAERRFVIDIRSGVDLSILATARGAGTVKNSRLQCPNPKCDESTPISAIRGDQRGKGGRGDGLRLWKNDDLVPRPDDVFQERLYCIRWRLPRLDALLRAEQGMGEVPVPGWIDLDRAIVGLTELLPNEDQREVEALRQRDWKAEEDGSEGAVADLARRVKELADSVPSVLYRRVEEADRKRETLTLELLRARFADWQHGGCVPSRGVTPGDETTRLLRERGWTHWHHLFTPRQLLVHGLFAEVSATLKMSVESKAACLLSLGRIADWNSKLARWWTDQGHEKVVQTFTNQALNTLVSYGGRGMRSLADSWFLTCRSAPVRAESMVEPTDARSIETPSDIWMTDPPYADAINYHELSEFFLAWYDKRLPELFPPWYADSKRALAIQGAGADFRRSMVDCYQHLSLRMPPNGLQVVMFTHQDASIWADLTLILWAAGLRVTAAWTIGTETPFGTKEGNYVQGTVLMVLRKQVSEEQVFIDEVVPEVESEVERQLKSMLQLDDREDPNFSDADYQLAAYAAALRVLTKYRSIEDIDIRRQLARERATGEENPIEAIIGDAVRTASNFLVPSGLPGHLWRRLRPEEKLYLKGLEVEGHGDYRSGVYQEFARGFGVRDYRFMLLTGKANQTRLKTASEFQRSDLSGSLFSTSLVRHALYAIWRTTETGEVTESLNWLRTELPEYWPQRESLIDVLRYLARIEIDHWQQDAAAARVVAGAVENDHV
ncbi:MAG: DUF1156 domain-containing protein [Gammaproteobacteria bacterium]|nr:DUF1156 domain-containing protein [Gammaproteobacteria bacterium]MYE53039.1 DUF1156 domain-containing protein [Gammaproteobacteria bacterium]